MLYYIQLLVTSSNRAFLRALVLIGQSVYNLEQWIMGSSQYAREIAATHVL